MSKGTCIIVWDAECRSVRGGQDYLSGNYSPMYWPYMELEGVQSPRGASIGRCVEAFTKFVASNSRDPPVFVVPVLVPARDLYLRVTKNYKPNCVSRRSQDTGLGGPRPIKA